MSGFGLYRDPDEEIREVEQHEEELEREEEPEQERGHGERAGVEAPGKGDDDAVTADEADQAGADAR